MKASFHNSILTNVSLVLFVLLLCGTTPAEVTVTPTLTDSTTHSTTFSNEFNATPTTAVTHVNFHSNRGMPRAREDVDPLKTALVPGHAIVPATSPGYAPPVNTFPVTQPTVPQQFVPQYSAPQYQPAPQNPADNNLGGSSVDDVQLKISSRATDPKMQGFLRTTSMQHLTSLFHEASRMIDSRHVTPPAYEVRMQAALNNLSNALENESFLRANNVSPNVAAIRQVQSQLAQTITSQPARNATEAVGIMQWSAELVNRQLGIKREAAALEFINGTIDSLDKYSAFMPESSASAPGAELEFSKTASLEENIVGIGVELETHPKGAILTGVVDKSPAAELGLREGDVLFTVNGQSMRGLSLNEVASKLGGPAGTRIQLEIERNGQGFRGTVTRRQIYVSSVTGTKMMDTTNMVGYVRLKQFSYSSTKDLEAALWQLHNQGMKSLVLDLRGNPGGLLDQAIDVSNLFLPCGTIVATKGRNTSDNTLEKATQQKTWSVPLVVLIDKNSASASEIFAAAIQENQRGVIVGRQSYGKGTVQTHFPLQTVSGLLKLTTAKFYSPAGREMAGTGVRPDVMIQETATGYRGVNGDADLEAALNTIRQGTPVQLAQLAGNCNRTPQVPNLTPNNFNQLFQQNTFGN